MGLRLFMVRKIFCAANHLTLNLYRKSVIEATNILIYVYMECVSSKKMQTRRPVQIACKQNPCRYPIPAGVYTFGIHPQAACLTFTYVIH